MSTKIYNGFKFRDQDFFTIHEQLKELKDFIKKDALWKIADFLRTSVITELDKAASTDTPIEPRLLGRHWTDMHDRQKKIEQTRRRDPDVDMEFGLTILIDPTTKKYYGIFYTEQRSWSDEIKSRPWCEEFAYWDGSDPPRRFTQEEWDERGETWARILRRGAPADYGYTMNVNTVHYYSDEMVNAVLTYLPTIEERALSQASKDAVDFHFAQYYRRDDTQGFHQAMKVLDEARKWRDTDEGKAFVERRTADLLTVIKPITRNVLED